MTPPTRSGGTGAEAGRGEPDVLVVGAGFAGLAAALALADAGRRVSIVEALPRVGGRTESGRTSDGQWLELGGQWVGPGHTRLRALIDRFGLRTEPTGQPGRLVALHRPAGSAALERREIDGGIDPAALLSTAERSEVDAALRTFATIVDSVVLEAPWLTPDAERLDRDTFAGWIAAMLPSAPARRYFSTACEAIFAPDPLEVSLLHAAFYFRSGGHLDALLGIERTSQEERVVGGASVVCEAIARHLEAEGHEVHLGRPVRTVQHGPSGVELVTRDGSVLRAPRAVLTLPPPLAGRLDYQPILPSARDQLTQRLHAISVVKLSLVYEHPFWREAGLSGEAVIDEGPIKVVLDNTPHGYRRGVLVAFIEGNDKRGWGLEHAAARRAAFIELAVRLFGPEAAHPVDYLDRDWTMQEFARGCYSGHFAPGTWTNYGPALTAPIGPLHWAGTETASEWTGYLEGAIASGFRAASEVLTALSGAAPAEPALPLPAPGR